MKKLIKPNYKKCILNISASIAEYLGSPNKNATLPKLNRELKKGYKNIVFICFDGLGMYPIKKNLEKTDFLRKNIKQELLSTFPSTTTNATTSLMFNKLPLEHGWFGWSMNFPNINRNVDIYLNKDSWTHEKIHVENTPLSKIDYYFDHTNCDYSINTIFPSYIKVNKPENNIVFDTMNDFFNQIINVCNRDNKQFVYAYYPEPDAAMHENGVTNEKSKQIIQSISDNCKKLYNSTNNTLFIITADHGQIDITEYVELYKDEKLMEMLEIYPYMEVRASAFKVKTDKRQEFEKYFKSKYGKDFKLYKSKYLIDKGYFGKCGDKGELLGDYISIGKYNNKFCLLTDSYPRFKGHHTSLTEEMEVPLIIIKN